VWLPSLLFSLALYGLSPLLPVQGAALVLISLSTFYAMMVGAKILYTVGRIPERRQIRRALLFTPVFLVVWLSSFLLAVFSGNQWLRSRPEMDPTTIG